MDTADIDETITHNGTGPTIGEIADAETGDDDAVATDPAEVELAATAAGAPDVATGFMSELTEAMMGVVGKERDRIGAIVEADAAAHLVEAKEHAAAEAEAFRQVADEDVASIEGWAEAEVERIRADAARRIADRRADLDSSLAQHDAVLEGELQGIETAVADYGVTLESFLDDLRTTGDPAEIADRSRSLPTPPEPQRCPRDRARRGADQDRRGSGRGRDARGRRGSEADDAEDGGRSEVPATAASGADDDAAECRRGGWGVSPGRGHPAPPHDAGRRFRGALGRVGRERCRDRGDPGRRRRRFDQLGLGDRRRPGDPHDPPAQTLSAAHVSASSNPVGVMDPAATSGTGWDTDIEAPVAVATAVATAEPEDVGHPNAAVRLIRSVAPWTAPTHSTGRTDDDAR